jgi:hypothetical protein
MEIEEFLFKPNFHLLNSKTPYVPLCSLSLVQTFPWTSIHWRFNMKVHYHNLLHYISWSSIDDEHIVETRKLSQKISFQDFSHTPLPRLLSLHFSFILSLTPPFTPSCTQNFSHTNHKEKKNLKLCLILSCKNDAKQKWRMKLVFAPKYFVLYYFKL